MIRGCVPRLDTAILTSSAFNEDGPPAVPKNRCGELKRPEDIAAKYGSASLARELRQYRLGTNK